MAHKLLKLVSFWEKLQTIKEFTCVAYSRSNGENGWNGKGNGEVLVIKPTNAVLVFHERGSWQVKPGQDMDFTNTLRWTLDRGAGMISLEHLRFGPDQPVFLVHLASTGDNLLGSIDPHLCEKDVYFATVPYDCYSIRFHWRVIGPKKNEEMEYCYT
jgi:hypothetical protein